jgi:hypothetical protein
MGNGLLLLLQLKPSTAHHLIYVHSPPLKPQSRLSPFPLRSHSHSHPH